MTLQTYLCNTLRTPEPFVKRTVTAALDNCFIKFVKPFARGTAFVRILYEVD